MKNYFVDVDGLFYVCKMMEIQHQKKTSYIINIFLIFNIFLHKVYSDFKH